MLNCNTLIINSNNVSTIGALNIGGIEMSINDDGDITTSDSEGNIKVFSNSSSNSNSSKLKHVEVSINDTVQTISNYYEVKIIYDDNFEVGVDSDYLLGDDGNSIKILNDGHYFISYNITLDMYSGNKSTCKSFVKSLSDGDTSTIYKSMSFEYFQESRKGFTSIGNSFIYEAKNGDELSLYVQRHEGTAKFYTVPENTNFNIFKID